MTPTSLTATTQYVDQRSWATQNATSDDQTSSSDQSFDGMLSTLHGDNASAPSKDDTAAETHANTAVAGIAHPTATWAAAARAADALSSQGAGAEIALAPLVLTATDKADAQPSTSSTMGKSAKGAASSDDTSDASNATPATGTATPSLDLFSMFGITVQQNAAAQAQTSAASTAAGVTGTVAGSKPADQDGPETDPAVTLASDISTFSHLAPATILPGAQPAATAPSAGKGAATGKVDPAKRNDPTAAAASSDIEAAAADGQDAKAVSPAINSSSSSSKTVAAIDTKADAVATASPTTGSMQASIQAIANAVSQLASSPADASETTPTTSASAANVPSDKTVSLAPARTMTLQLTPADLGTVSVRLHMTGDTLDVSLGVSSQQTLGLLTRDQGSLSSALTSQSYQLNSLVIQGTDPAAGSSGGNNASQGDSGGQARPNQDSSGSGARDPNGAARQQNGARQQPAARAASAPSDSQLYV